MPLLGRLQRVSSSRPYVTWGLLLGLLAWHVYVTGGAAQPAAATLVEYGARKATMGFPQAPWRLFASMFLHGNWWHLISNLVVLGFWGACLERVLGRMEMLALFFLTGLGSNILSDIFGPNMIAMGASGAVFGMVAAVLVLAILAPDWSVWQGESRRWLQVSLAALALNLVTAFSFATLVQGARLDHWAHGAGAAAGVLLALPAGLAGEERRRVAFWMTAALMAGAVGAALATRGASPFG